MVSRAIRALKEAGDVNRTWFTMQASLFTKNSKSGVW
jgi:hypothetical protein